MALVLCEIHTPARRAAGKSGAHAETPECEWPHEIAPSGPVPALGHPLRSCD